MSNIQYLFSPFVYKTLILEQTHLKEKLVPLIEENSRIDPNNAWDWNVHTSYDQEYNLPNKIDWESLLLLYKPYITNFLTNFFGKEIEYSVSGTPWYTLYAKGQNANTHEHLPDNFAIVHYLKFNPEVHWPISMVNPNGAATKYLLNLNPALKDKLNFENEKQSYFHPRFTPKVQEGDLLIFPGQLEHLVEKSYSEETRITIAFNINVL